MKKLRQCRIGALAVLALAGAAACSDAEASSNEMIVYAMQGCGCCTGWVEHMRENGFTVQVVYLDDLSAVRAKHKVPQEMQSCHMGVVDGFAVEGHVPASAVQRLLTEKPQILGIAVPGMPTGSPGMEHPSGHVEPYEVYSFDASGPREIFQLIK